MLVGRASVTYAVWSEEDKEFGAPQSQGYYYDGHHMPGIHHDTRVSIRDAIAGGVFRGGHAELAHNGGMIASAEPDVDFQAGTECHYTLHVDCKPETFRRLCAHIGATL